MALKVSSALNHLLLGDRLWLVPRLLDQRRYLATMVGLVIEKMQQHMAERKHMLTRVDDGGKTKIPSQHLLVQGRAEVEYFPIGLRALPPQLVKIRVQLLIQGIDLEGAIDEPADPQPVTQQQVIECAVDGFEKRTAIAPALRVGNVRANGVEPLVHPAVVLRHGSESIQRTHGFPPPMLRPRT